MHVKLLEPAPRLAQNAPCYSSFAERVKLVPSCSRYRRCLVLSYGRSEFGRAILVLTTGVPAVGCCCWLLALICPPGIPLYRPLCKASARARARDRAFDTAEGHAAVAFSAPCDIADLLSRLPHT